MYCLRKCQLSFIKKQRFLNKPEFQSRQGAADTQWLNIGRRHHALFTEQ